MDSVMIMNIDTNRWHAMGAFGRISEGLNDADMAGIWLTFQTQIHIAAMPLYLYNTLF